MPNKNDISEEAREQRLKMLIESKSDQSRLYDRAIISLASGAFAISAYAIRELDVGDGSTELLLGLGFFGLSVVLTLTSFQTSQGMHAEDMKSLLKQSFSARKRSVFSIVTMIANVLSLGFFILGVIWLFLFACSYVNR